jgi:hypothetical protein
LLLHPIPQKLNLALNLCNIPQTLGHHPLRFISLPLSQSEYRLQPKYESFSHPDLSLPSLRTH